MGTTERDCIEALREAASRLGESPTKAAYEELELTPSSTTIRRVMGGWNAAKEAAGLETFSQSQGRDVPIQPEPEWVDLPESYEWAELTPQQRWYYKNQEHRIEVKTRRKHELQRWFYEYKRDECQCERCGEDYPACLDFHHVGEKTVDVSRMVNHGYSRESIEAEIDRCVVLCANCHQKEHLESNTEDPSNREEFGRKRRRRLELRAWVGEYQQSSGGCARCAETDPACLEYHHVDENEKDRSIGTMIAYTPSKERLMEEIEKCEILCRNCHRKEHYEVPDPMSSQD